MLEAGADIAAEPTEEFSYPRPGRSLGATVVTHAAAIRLAVETLQVSNPSTTPATPIHAAFDITPLRAGAELEPWELRAKWFAVAAASAHYVVCRPNKPSLHEALRWLLGEAKADLTVACFSAQSFNAADLYLGQLGAHEVVRGLLPYLFEPHGHVTRSKLETCERAQATRIVKRRDGVYYTPSDVAEFMVRASSEHAHQEVWLDPACGTGVFLRAVLKHLRQWSPDAPSCELLQKVHGVDKSALATDLAAFVLLSDAMASTKNRPNDENPYEVWCAIKRRLWCGDSLILFGASQNENVLSLESGVLPWQQGGRLVVIMNPPYGKNGPRRRDLHLAFTELLSSLCERGAKGAAVLPLAIGANTTRSYISMRSKLTAGGQSKFLFFDREPQALFGEDIKTRNTILLHDRRAPTTRVQTSRMVKWTAQQRHTIFDEGRLVDIEADLCRTFVPKLGSAAEADAYVHLRSRRIRNQAALAAPQIRRVALSGAVALATEQKNRTLLVAPTAYNFLNCFLADDLPVTHGRLSESAVHAYVFSNETQACAALAALSSRLAFWLWHVEGDGFHVTQDFLTRLPIWTALATTRQPLQTLGSEIRCEGKRNRWRSVNGGRETYSFPIDFNGESAIAIEALLLRATGLPLSFSQQLAKAVDAIVSIDGTTRRASTRVQTERA
jgi:hypothetical protein